MKPEYKDLVLRNQGYIDSTTQKRLSECRLLIAGCGIGSQIALAATRLGFKNFVLIDGDKVSPSNLNRQGFNFSQIGKFKAAALKENILQINPDCEVKAISENLSKRHLEILDGVELIFDTIDFLDLKAILLLHEEAESKQIPLMTGMSVGWGACVMYFPNRNQQQQLFRKIFDISSDEELHGLSYLEKFSALFRSFTGHLDQTVIDVMLETFKSMQDGKPCPAPQVVSGALCLASLMTTAAFKILSGESPQLPEAPELVLIDMKNALTEARISLLELKN